MGTLFHKHRKSDGSTVYRLWNTSLYRYVSGEMTEEEALQNHRLQLLSEAIYEILDTQHWERDLRMFEEVTDWWPETVDENKGVDEDRIPTAILEIFHGCVLADDLAKIALQAIMAELDRRNKSNK